MPASGQPQRLDHLAVVEFGGADAGRFLQGQLSNDVAALGEAAWQLTSLSNPKGRVVAVLQLTRAGERFYAVLPQALAPAVVERLTRYVLRSRVSLRIANPELAVFGIPELPGRWSVAQHTSAPDPSDAPALARACRLAAIAAGHPQIYPATSELFVAQMLNLDLVDAVSFRKGCYTGQEIIARTQNLGRIKRRMLRFATGASASLVAGDMVALDGFGPATVVEAALTDKGEQELLAVVHLEPSTAEAGSDERTRIEVCELPLPYRIPERGPVRASAPPSA